MFKPQYRKSRMNLKPLGFSIVRYSIIPIATVAISALMRPYARNI